MKRMQQRGKGKEERKRGRGRRVLSTAILFPRKLHAPKPIGATFRCFSLPADMSPLSGPNRRSWDELGCPCAGQSCQGSGFSSLYFCSNCSRTYSRPRTCRTRSICGSLGPVTHAAPECPGQTHDRGWLNVVYEGRTCSSSLIQGPSRQGVWSPVKRWSPRESSACQNGKPLGLFSQAVIVH